MDRGLDSGGGGRSGLDFIGNKDKSPTAILAVGLESSAWLAKLPFPENSFTNSPFRDFLGDDE